MVGRVRIQPLRQSQDSPQTRARTRRVQKLPPFPLVASPRVQIASSSTRCRGGVNSVALLACLLKQAKLVAFAAQNRRNQAAVRLSGRATGAGEFTPRRACPEDRAFHVARSLTNPPLQLHCAALLGRFDFDGFRALGLAVESIPRSFRSHAEASETGVFAARKNQPRNPFGGRAGESAPLWNRPS